MQWNLHLINERFHETVAQICATKMYKRGLILSDPTMSFGHTCMHTQSLSSYDELSQIQRRFELGVLSAVTIFERRLNDCAL